MAVNRRTVRGIVLLLGLACGASTPIAQQPSPAQTSQTTPTPTFRASVRWVDVDAVVRDKDGNFVTGLTKDDFEILEDNQPQTLDRATLVDLLPVIPTPGLNQPVDAGETEKDFQSAGRIYVLVLDSGVDDAVRKLARQFIEQHLGPIDRMAVVSVHGRGDQALTSDKTRLLAAVDQYRSSDGEWYRRRLGETLNGVQRTYATLKEVAVGLGGVTGRRKSILFIGKGVDLWADNEVAGPGWEDVHSLWDMVNDVTRTAAGFNVPIHTISPEGLVVKHDRAAVNTSPPRALSLDGLPMSGGSWPGHITGQRSTQQKRDTGLGVLSERTRGVRIINTTNYTNGFRKIVAENSQYYMLGYYSTLEPDGRFHKITIKVNRPDVSVTGRDGFRSMKPEVKAKTVSLPKSLTQTARLALTSSTGGQLPLETNAVLFRGENFTASVLVHTTVKGTDISLTDSDKIEYAAAAFDRSGRIVAVDRHAFSMALQPATRARIESDGVHLFSRLTLPIGTYEIRVVAQQPGGRLGRSTTPISVPDFMDRSLLISDVLVGGPATDSPLTLLPDETLRRMLTGTPAATNRFTNKENRPVFAEIYDTQWLISPAIGVKWKLRSEDGTVTGQGEERIDNSDKGRIYFRGALPLSRLQPGTYLLELEAFSIGGPPAATMHQLRFEVTSG